ncbi:MAG: helix-turn-helix domain-containing protein [Lysobacteraceae bacterium]
MNVPASSLPAADTSPAAPAVLRDVVAYSVRRYLHDLHDHQADDLYEVVLREIEAPLFREVLRHYDGNQSRAAATLGLNRATLRKKLRAHGIVS